MLTWCRGNGRVGDPSGSMRSSATAAQSSATRLQLLRVAAQEGVMSDRISNGNAIPYHLAYCCWIPRIYAGLLFFTSLILHLSMDFRIAHARHFGHVGFHLVAITIRRPGICHASCRSVDSLETSVPPDTYLLRHRTRTRIGIGVGIRNAVHIPPVEAFGVSFSAQLLQDRAVWNL